MLRSAAKNFAAVYALVDPVDYESVVHALEAGDDDLDLRRFLAEKVYAHTAAYDAAIARWFALLDGEQFPANVTIALERAQTLRYGENPSQHAAFYVENRGEGLDRLTQRGGRELSFNNLLDLEGALFAIDSFAGQTACADHQAYEPVRHCGWQLRHRCVQESARVRSRVGIRVGHCVHGAGGRRRRRSHLVAVRGVHRCPGVLSGRGGYPWSQEESACTRGNRAVACRRARHEARAWRISRARARAALVTMRPVGALPRHASRRTKSTRPCVSRGAPSPASNPMRSCS